MKIPPYITITDKKLTKEIANKLKKQQGISAYLFFKKISFVAMYGELFSWKMNYTEFLGEILKHIRRKTNTNSIFYFWNYNNVTQNTTDRNYNIPKNLIKYGTLTQIEIAIYNNVLRLKEVRNMLDKNKLKQIENIDETFHI